MFSKIVVFATFLAIVKAAPGGIVPVGGLGTPAATTLVAGPAPAVLAAPAVYAAAPGPIVKTATATIAAGPAPVAYAAPAPVIAAAPVAYAAPAPVAIPAPVTYTSGVKVAHILEPVEQHGYKIHY